MTLHVLFEVGGSEYVLPAAEVAQMESFEGATHVPGAPPWVIGVVQLRGRVVPVVDVRRRFGLPSAELGLDSRLVVVSQGERAVGLLVDRAREVVELSEADFAPPPQAVAHEVHGFVTAIARSKERLFMRMDAQQVIGNEELGHE